MRLQNEYKWLKVLSCPACKSKSFTVSSSIKEDEYIYKNVSIPIPHGGIFFKRCTSCSLIYKNIILSPNSLSEIVDKLQGRIWSTGYDYAKEVSLVKKIIKKGDIDILEIGATRGWFLRAFSKYGGRRAGLDVTKDTIIDSCLRGEFIEGLIDSPDLVWSKEPYDVVGFFDVIEHLYNPRIAFSNLYSLVKDNGIVLLETGDSESAWPVRFGIGTWWYARLFPHHIFWSMKSLEIIAGEYGFEVLSHKNKRNKNVTIIPWAIRFRDFIKASCYWMSPTLYRFLLKSFNREFSIPRNFFARDHLQILMRKVSN